MLKKVKYLIDILNDVYSFNVADFDHCILYDFQDSETGCERYFDILTTYKRLQLSKLGRQGTSQFITNIEQDSIGLIEEKVESLSELDEIKHSYNLFIFNWETPYTEVWPVSDTDNDLFDI